MQIKGIDVVLHVRTQSGTDATCGLRIQSHFSEKHGIVTLKKRALKPIFRWHGIKSCMWSGTMADQIKIVLNRAGVAELLKSNEIMAAFKSAAETIRGNYAGETELEEYVGRNRVNVAIVAPMNEAQKDNSLLKAVHE